MWSTLGSGQAAGDVFTAGDDSGDDLESVSLANLYRVGRLWFRGRDEATLLLSSEWKNEPCK